MGPLRWGVYSSMRREHAVGEKTLVTSKQRPTWQKLERWYDEKARSTIEEWDPQRVSSLDSARERLKRLADTVERQFKVCILGKAGVGKSTLLNALIDEKLAVLPQGGIGPLTAQAIVVQHADEAYFHVRYHGRQRLNQVLFALQRQAELEFGWEDRTTLDAVRSELDAESIAEVEFEVPPTASEAGAKASPAKGEGYLQQGRLIVQGDQFAKTEDIRYVVDGLRACLDLQPVFGSVLTPEDQSRVGLVKEILPPRATKKTSSQTVERKVARASPNFLKTLKEHAAGALAPLVAELHVGWPAPVLASGATLVDLPGVGIANDEYRRVTQLHVRDARAVGIVVDRAGLDEASAEMLRDTGFLNSLLLESGDEKAEPIHLFIAVVKLDLTADDLVDEAMNAGDEADWLSCFEDSRRRAIDMVKGQFKLELNKLAADSGESTRKDMEALVARLLNAVEVFPVAAMEYRKLHMKNGAKIQSPAQSFIPQLGSAIESAAAERRERLEAAFADSLRSFHHALESALGILEERARKDERVETEVRALRDEFQRFSEPLSKEMAARKGAFRTFLRETVPSQITGRLLSATEEVRKDLQRHLKKYREYPWQTLRATVRRGGAFVGARTVDMPSELTLKFEEPVALLWSKEILTLIRRRTRELGDDNIRVATSVVDWAKSQGGRVPPRVVELLESDLRTDSRQLADVGKDAIDDLKERVKHALYEATQTRIRKACQKFVDDGRANGVGVKDRMHSFFETELADAVLEAARPAAETVLTKNYEEVQDEVLAALKKLVDPVDRASELVVERHATAILKKDKEKREDLEAILKRLKLPALN